MPFPIELKNIEETELELGYKFPDKFKAKMVKENGGEIVIIDEEEDYVWWLFPFFDKSDKKRMSRTSNNIIYQTKEMRKWNNFPSQGVAIASDGGGDCLILLPEDKAPDTLKENIYEWFHETGEIVELAHSINDLMGSK